MQPLKVAIVGFGKIARDQHLPAIEANPRFEFVASVDRSGKGPAPNFTSHQDMLASGIEIDCAAITTPPSVRYAIASDCLAAGLHLLLEKPPTGTLGEIEDLAPRAKEQDLTLFTTWHAQHNAAVPIAAEALRGQRVRSMRVTWHEDVRKWHPGQKWIWEPGGFGVFDPGINAFSIMTRIFPGALFIKQADLAFPEGAHTPVAAEIEFGTPEFDADLHCSLDWRRSEGEEWTIAVALENGGSVELRDGGARLLINGEEQATSGAGEYPDIYRQFVDLIDARESLVDTSPLRLVADCLLVGRRQSVAPIDN